MRVHYTPDASKYEQYYRSQTGNGLPIYIGGIRGGGIGSVLGGLFRSVAPLIKRSGRSLLKEGVSTGLNIANDVLSGENLKQSIKKRSRNAGKRMLKRAIDQFVPPPPGEPVSKRIKRKKRVSKRHSDIFA